MARKRKRKGFSYHPSEEMLDRFLSWPLELRFRWVMDTVALLAKMASKETKKLWEEYRKGEI